MAELAPILVVEDHPNIRTEILKTLTAAGFQVEAVSSGAEAYERFSPAAYSLVIADENASGTDGPTLLNSVKNKMPQIPVIMMTGNGSVQNAVKTMQAGAADYLLKPFAAETLAKTVKRAVGAANGNGARRCDPRQSDGAVKVKETITANQKMLDILKQARGVAPSSATVLIRGESGTGKELLAAYVHQHGRHPQAPYVALNCAALPDTLAESELFGHEKGSFTGAVGRKIGKFEQAQKGTVVLDEISEMPLPLQAKLLRVLQEKEVDRIGGNRPVPIEARVIAISNVDLKTAVVEGKFREDLYYRINVIPLLLPPLRERKDDIELLAKHFLEKFSRANRKKVTGLDRAAVKMLCAHEWKGNVRELENVIERAVLIADGPRILAEHLLLDSSADTSPSSEHLAFQAGCTVRQMEKKLIFNTLKEVEDNRTQAAELLGISIRTLRNKLHEYKAEAASES